MFANSLASLLAERDVALRGSERGVRESKRAFAERKRFNHGRDDAFNEPVLALKFRPSRAR
jgi:hypothetical protein